MPDIAGLKADPSFQKLTPDRQKALLDHLGGGMAAPQSLGQQAEQGYEQNIAKPLTGLVQRGEDYVGIPKWAQQGSFNPINPQNVVPQTLTGAVLDAASLALPELKAGRVLGEAAGPAARFVGSRLGRVATMGGIGAGTEALTGGSPGMGVVQGVGGETVAQGVRGALSMGTRRMFKSGMLQDTTKQFGKVLSDALPWLGNKLQTTKDFADQFIHGGAVKKAQILLDHAKGDIIRQSQGLPFTIPDLNQGVDIQTGRAPSLSVPGGSALKAVDFKTADNMVTRLNRLSHMPSGDPRTGAPAADYNEIGHRLRNQIATRLNNHKAGLGDQYLVARKRLDAAFTLGGHADLKKGGIFRDEGIFDPETQALHQPTIINKINKESDALGRSLGEAQRDKLLDTLRRGAKGEVQDIPSKGEEKARARIGVSPMGHIHATAHPGHTYMAVGRTPYYYDPPHSPFEITTQNIISDMESHQPEEHSLGPGMKALDTSRAEHLAPTPSASKKAEKVTNQLRKGKRPDVHNDLNRGRLSLDETNKLVQQVASNDPRAMIQGVPLTELMDALETSDPHERGMLMPLVLERLKQELPQQQNKTLQANLAQRWKRIQQMPSLETMEA